MPFIVFDTETTGLPYIFNRKANPSTLANWDSCRLVQIAWMIFNDEMQLMSNQCHLIIPDGFVIPQQATAIHNITTERATENGIPIVELLNLLKTDIRHYNVDTIVAHNIDFDNNVILSEMFRSGVSVVLWRSLNQYCTMRSNIKQCGGRFPKLNVLYTKMIGPIDESITLHSADSDCRLCAEIYIKMQS